MSGWILWPGVVLLLGGGLLALVGRFWYYTAKLLRFFFELDVDPDKGFKVAMVGLVLLLAGIGLLYFGR